MKFLSFFLMSAAIFIFSTAAVYPADEEDIQSLTEERRDTLKYGIDSEVISLIGTLTDDKDDSLTAEIAATYDNTLNPEIMNAAVDYFIAVDYSGASDTSERILKNYEEENAASLSPALRYISEFPGPESEELISAMVTHDSMTLASAALSALGNCGTENSADMLLDLLDDDDYYDELKPAVIKALGRIGAVSAVDTLIDILEDVDEEKSWRWNSCEALGLIGDKSALPAIETALQDRDTYLRAYAVKALAGFDSPEIEDTLIQSLRDSFWRVRVSAAEALGELKSSKAVDILIYKAEKDPELNVKKAAVRSLGEIGDLKSFDFLREIYRKSNSPQSLRTISVEILVEKDLAASIDTIGEVLAEEWEKDNSPVLGYTCKFLSTAKSPRLSEIFSKMLEHNDVAVKIYGIRGVRENHLTGLKERIKSLSGEGMNSAVRKAALSALEEL